jgi:hypothetical protein
VVDIIVTIVIGVVVWVRVQLAGWCRGRYAEAVIATVLCNGCRCVDVCRRDTAAATKATTVVTARRSRRLARVWHERAVVTCIRNSCTTATGIRSSSRHATGAPQYPARTIAVDVVVARVSMGVAVKVRLIRVGNGIAVVNRRADAVPVGVVLLVVRTRVARVAWQTSQTARSQRKTQSEPTAVAVIGFEFAAQTVQLNESHGGQWALGARNRSTYQRRHRRDAERHLPRPSRS